MDRLARQDRRIRYLNVERYRRLLKHATDEDRRRRLQELIDEGSKAKKRRGSKLSILRRAYGIKSEPAPSEYNRASYSFIIYRRIALVSRNVFYIFYNMTNENKVSNGP